jgi:hypothetical protein
MATILEMPVEIARAMRVATMKPIAIPKIAKLRNKTILAGLTTRALKTSPIHSLRGTAAH